MSNELRLGSEKRLRIFTGRGYPELAQEVASELGVTITPTSAYTAIQSWTIPYKEASSLKNMQFDVFNGGALKASSGLVPCIWK